MSYTGLPKIYQRMLCLCCYLALYFTSIAHEVKNLPQDNNVPIESTPDQEDIPEIAISLDDAPMPGTILFSGIKKTEAIIQKLHEVNSPSVGIFALGIHAQGAQNMERLRIYGEAGHIISNHTYHHYMLNKISTQVFIEDIQKAHEHLSSLPNFRPFFRFPYLCEGKDNEQRQEVMHALQTMGYREGYVTVSNHDYYINKLVIQAAKAGKHINYEKLKEVYIRILWDCIKTYDQLSHKVLKRKIKHVLLLHENDLAALFIGDLITYIREQGWKIISIEEAYQDPIAFIDLQNNYAYSGRLAAIAVDKGLGKGLVDFPATTHLDYIAKALEKAGVFTTP